VKIKKEKPWYATISGISPRAKVFFSSRGTGASEQIPSFFSDMRSPTEKLSNKLIAWKLALHGRSYDSLDHAFPVHKKMKFEKIACRVITGEISG
jgi:acetylornithine/succinyldiaminopimelate/putrescine aminotransferase